MISHISFIYNKIGCDKRQKIAVVGVGYFGLSIATLLAQHNHVVLANVVPEKVEKDNKRMNQPDSR